MKCPACGARLDWMAWGPCAYGTEGVEAYTCGSRYVEGAQRVPCEVSISEKTTPLKELTQ